jgi:hypothetical protein
MTLDFVRSITAAAFSAGRFDGHLAWMMRREQREKLNQI